MKHCHRYLKALPPLLEQLPRGRMSMTYNTLLPSSSFQVYCRTFSKTCHCSE